MSLNEMKWRMDAAAELNRYLIKNFSEQAVFNQWPECTALFDDPQGKQHDMDYWIFVDEHGFNAVGGNIRTGEAFQWIYFAATASER